MSNISSTISTTISAAFSDRSSTDSQHAPVQPTIEKDFVIDKQLLSAMSSPSQFWCLEDPLEHLMMLINQRLLISHQVAQATWNAKVEINNTEHDKKTLDELAVSWSYASETELFFLRRFFQAQFDASKIVQNAWHTLWMQQKRHPFADISLTNAIRHKLDHLTAMLGEAWRQVQPQLAQVEINGYIKQQLQSALTSDNADQGLDNASTIMQAHRSARAKALSVLLLPIGRSDGF